MDEVPITLSKSPSKSHVERINKELRAAGAVAYNMWLPETHYLPHLIKQNEHIKGTVYGRYKDGRGVLIATDQRILFLDKKPLFMHRDDITFNIVSGISRTRIGIIGTVTLRTREGNYTIRTFNQKNAKNFVDYVTSEYLKEEGKERR
jgi:hypothetical protein